MAAATSISQSEWEKPESPKFKGSTDVGSSTFRTRGRRRDGVDQYSSPWLGFHCFGWMSQEMRNNPF